MKIIFGLSLICFVLQFPVAWSRPQLAGQQNWSKKDKDQFIQSIKGSGSIFDRNKKVAISPRPEERAKIGNHDSKYIMMHYDGGRSLSLSTQNFGVNHYRHGPAIYFGNHLFSWIRYALGTEYHQVRMKMLPYDYYYLSEITIPLWFEFALIPLGSPHTRYLILRSGLQGNYLWGKTEEITQLNLNNPEIKTSTESPDVLGLSTYWITGLGYEWQLGENFWRVHVLANVQVPLTQRHLRKFINLNTSIGTSYVF